ncbi:uncharacterized protein HaLaN_07981 [Haematococcus lacustris]|uniref:Uncharacterized protein n=1 Tax=Haematococcus lacustris TaxID=44745 RepID=A0A699Z9W8_HAELA|nr:uncharacterized protein HaLaN_07981 [Haematococcus lacustris]
MLTFALSLLLVFKTNSSYARWWEGRVVWGQVVNFGRNLPRLMLTWAPRETAEDVAAIRTALRWSAAAAHIMRCHVRQHTSKEAERGAAHLLSPPELEYLAAGWTHRPLGVAHVLSRLVARSRGGMDSMMQVG